MRSNPTPASPGPDRGRRHLIVSAVSLLAFSLLAPAVAKAEPRTTRSVPPSTVRGRDTAGWVQVGPLFPRVNVQARPVGSVLEIGSLQASSASFDVLGYRVEQPRARFSGALHAELGEDGVFRFGPRTIPVRMQALLVPTWGGQSIPIDVLGTNASIVLGRFHPETGVVRMRGEFVHAPDSGPPLARAELDLHLGNPETGAVRGGGGMQPG